MMKLKVSACDVFANLISVHVKLMDIFLTRIVCLPLFIAATLLLTTSNGWVEFCQSVAYRYMKMLSGVDMQLCSIKQQTCTHKADLCISALVPVVVLFL